MRIRIWRMMMRSRYVLLLLLAGTAAQAADLPANELGKIPVLTYHKISDEDTEYTRNRTSFMNDLVQLKKLGFYPITLNEFRNGKIAAPKGKIPLLITFDDSSESQFKYEADGSLTPGCGVEIMERFQKANADFPLRGVFFVLPKAQYPNNFFGQPAKIGAKLKYLTGRGFEIGSHTLWHANLKKYRNKIEEQLGLGTAEIQKYLKGYAVYSFALPYGIFPPKADEHRLRAGTFKGKAYRHDMIFDYSNALSYSVYDKKFDTYHIRRLHGNEKTLQKLFKQAREKREIFFVSDGDPETVTVRKADAGHVRLRRGQKLATY